MSDENIEIVANPPNISLSRFWEEIGSDLDKGVESFKAARKTELSAVLAAAIVESFNKDLFTHVSFIEENKHRFLAHKTSWRRFIRRFWNNRNKILFVLVMLLFLSGLAYLAWLNFQKIDSQVIVRRTGGLPAFHKIMPEDITIYSLSSFKQESEPDKTFVGRHVLLPVAENSVITEENLLRSELADEANERSVLSIPVNSNSLHKSLGSNRKIKLILSKTKEPFEQSAVISEVILLGIEKRENSSNITIALTLEQLSKISPLLGSSEIFITQ